MNKWRVVCTGIIHTGWHTQKRELFRHILCAFRLLSGSAIIWAYKLDRAGFEEWAQDNNKGRKVLHCSITPWHINSTMTVRFSAQNNTVPWFSCSIQWNGFAGHINFALVEMTVLQLPVIVLDANLMQSFLCQSNVWMQSSKHYCLEHSTTEAAI